MAGGKKAAIKNKQRNLHHYEEIGALGGKKSRGGGFAANPELASSAGRVGGTRSKRGKALSPKPDNSYHTAA